jgi:hypothetical protein
MKSLAFLAIAVSLLVGVWLVAGLRDASAPAGIDIFSKPDDRSTPVNSVKKLRDVQPTSEEVGEAVRLLGVLSESLTEAEWPQTAHDLFAGWDRIRRVTGARETLDSLSSDFLLRLVPHLDVAQLKTLIRSANGQDPYAPQIDAALASFSKRPEAVDRLVEASIRAQDFKRASRVLAEGRFDPSTPAARLAQSLESYHRVDIFGAVEAWGKVGEDKVMRPILLATSTLIARADATTLKEALAKTRSLEGAGDYWGEVIRR